MKNYFAIFICIILIPANNLYASEQNINASVNQDSKIHQEGTYQNTQVIKELDNNSNKNDTSKIDKASEENSNQENSNQENPILVATTDHTNNGEFYSSDLIEGNPKAKVVIIEYFALTCFHCAYFHKTVYPQLKAKYIDTNKIAFVHREFIQSKQDMEAAILARCAGPIKKKAFYDVLLEQQETWAFNRNYSQILTNIGQLGGVTPDQYQKCLKDEALGTTLMDNTKLIARTSGFVGTPAFIINNKIYPGIATLEAFSKIIDPLLDK